MVGFFSKRRRIRDADGLGRRVRMGGREGLVFVRRFVYSIFSLV